jgi:hypothetical protein
MTESSHPEEPITKPEERIINGKTYACRVVQGDDTYHVIVTKDGKDIEYRVPLPFETVTDAETNPLAAGMLEQTCRQLLDQLEERLTKPKK